MYLAEKDREDIFEILLKQIQNAGSIETAVAQLAGYSSNEQYKYTPLHHAVARDCKGTVEYIISYLQEKKNNNALKAILTSEDSNRHTVVQDANEDIKSTLKQALKEVENATKNDNKRKGGIKDASTPTSKKAQKTESANKSD